MRLFSIDIVSGVDETQHPEKILADLCRVLFETQRKVMEINNECILLRQELDELRRRVR